jgi:hypothetical protein
MTDRGDDIDRLSKRAKAAATEVSTGVEDASEDAAAHLRAAAKEAFEKIKTARARALKKIG